MTAKSAPVNKRGASKSPHAKKNKKPNISGGVWLITGLALGFFAAFLMGLTPSAVDVRSITESDSGSAAEDQKDRNKPVFDFYTLLPESEVTVPSVEQVPERQVKKTVKKKAAVTKNTEAKPEAPAKPKRYLLQAGSFRNSKDADRLRAQLLLQGLVPKVEQVNVGGGETWFRVQLGPFEDQESLTQTRAVLASNNIDSLLLQLK